MSVSSPPVEPEQQARRPSRLVAIAGVLATLLVFGACAQLLIKRALTVEVPESVLIVRGSPEWEGTQAIVDGFALPRPLKANFDHDSRYTISFHLAAGQYTLTINKDEQRVYGGRFALRKSSTGVLRLPDKPGEKQPSTQPLTPFGSPVRW